MTERPVRDDVTALLRDWGAGDRSALDRLTPMVEQELRRLARRHMARERRDHTLQPTALVNEAFLRLVDQNRIEWQNRAHFYGVAAQLMRFILVDHARRRGYAKRGGGAERVELEESLLSTEDRTADLLVLDHALTALAAVDERKSRVAELRFFGGLSVEETAEALSVSGITVMRDWQFAKAWLKRELTRSSST